MINLPYFPNEDWSEIFLLFDQEGEIIDLTGAELEMMFRPHAESEILYATATLANGKIEFEPNLTAENLAKESKTGTGIKVSLTAAETLAIFYGSRSAQTDLKLTIPGSSEPQHLMDLCLEPIIKNTRNYPLENPSP